MPAAVIINPVAGGRRRSLPPAERVALVERALARRGTSGLVHVTEAPGHGRELARQAVADGCSPVVAWGGDGTISEVASQLMATGTPLGIVRAGSGNGLARELGIPAAPDRAIDIALGGRERVVDVGEIDGQPFLNVAGIGFDAAMALEFNRLGGERRGPLRYTWQVVRAAFGYAATRYVIEIDGRRVEANALLVAIANLAQYGSNAVIAPGAKPDDGLLDVVIVEQRGALGRIGLVPRVFDRTIHKAPGVTILPARTVAVRAAVPMAFHVDGEPHQGGVTLEACIHPGALIVRVP
jgi:diacylglycerol kinase (ATP)